MKYNLLLIKYDKICTQFIDGNIPLECFLKIENEYLKRYKLFTINLN